MPEKALGGDAEAEPNSPSVEPGQAIASRIQGVIYQRAAGFHDHRGDLVPFLDAADSFWLEPVVWAYLITVRPGRIKGWGMHRLQTDRYFVVAGDLRVVLYDGRDGSPTRGSFCEFQFTDNVHGRLAIPPGVWHATQNWGTTLGRITNFPTRRYDPNAPDKLRIDPHGPEIPFDWRLPDG
jgi:dTDP-4-dehydrorhamnose 3,5-epimerase